MHERIKQAEAKGVRFTLTAEEDDNHSSWKLFPADIVEDIKARLYEGEVWAWADVTLAATFQGVEGEASLGGCSYKDMEDFIQTSGYYEQMCLDALDELEDVLTFYRSCANDYFGPERN